MPPLRAYVDTCVVSSLARGDTPAKEVEAVKALMRAFNDGKVDLTTSPLTLEELSKIPDQYRALHVDVYNSLAKVPRPRDFRVTPPFGPTDYPHGRQPHPLLVYISSVLPDRPDAQHVFGAIQNGIMWVVTLDRETMLRHASELESRSGAKLRSPSDFVAENAAELAQC